MQNTRKHVGFVYKKWLSPLMCRYFPWGYLRMCPHYNPSQTRSNPGIVHSHYCELNLGNQKIHKSVMCGMTIKAALSSL